MAISVAIFFALFFVFACKSERSLFKTGILDNKWLIYAVAISVILHLLVIYTFIGKMFGFFPLNLTQLGIILLASLPGLVFFEAWKLAKGGR